MLASRTMLLIGYIIVWATALVLSVALFAMSTSSLSRVLFAVAALMAIARLLNGPHEPLERQRQPPGPPTGTA